MLSGTTAVSPISLELSHGTCPSKTSWAFSLKTDTHIIASHGKTRARSSVCDTSRISFFSIMSAYSRIVRYVDTMNTRRSAIRYDIFSTLDLKTGGKNFFGSSARGSYRTRPAILLIFDGNFFHCGNSSWTEFHA